MSEEATLRALNNEMDEAIFDELMADYEDRVLVEKVKILLRWPREDEFNPWNGPLLYAIMSVRKK